MMKNVKVLAENEEKLRVEALQEQLNTIETSRLDIAGLGSNYVSYEGFKYVWYRPKSKKEIDILNEYYNLTFDNDAINHWVSVEVCLYAAGAYRGITLKQSMENIKQFLNGFGYDVEIKERG